MRDRLHRYRVVLLGLVGLCSLLSWPVHAQQIDLSIDRSTVGPGAVTDYDFSWVYWFETRGQRYVQPSLADRPLPWDTPASRRWRDEAVAALEPMLADVDDRVRAAAVIALAQMGHEPLIDRVLGSVEAGRAGLMVDASPSVRLAAWTALGLLDTPRARLTLLIDPLPTATEQDRAAQAMAIGLLEKPVKAHAEWLAARLADRAESHEVKRWCVWSLERIAEATGADRGFAYSALLREVPSVFVVGEVLLSPSYASRNGGADWLIDVLRYHPTVRRWPGYVALSTMPVEGTFGSTPQRLAMETRVAAALTIADLPRPRTQPEREELLERLRRRMIAGNSAQAMDFNRGFDTIAYAMHCDVTSDQLDLLYDQLRGFTMLPLDDPKLDEKREALAEGDALPERDRFVTQSRNAVRPYTAIAVGLLIRRATEGTELYEERPVLADRAIEIERLKRRFGVRLMRAVANPREPMAYRAACALALGLTGDDRYVEDLTTELSKLRSGDEPVLGYGLLALSMLGEQRVVEPARRYVTRPGTIRGIDDRLGRQAALRAVGLLDWQLGEQAGAALSGAWGRDIWVSLHAAQATAWLGRYDAVPAMLQATTSESGNWRRIAALSLGRAFEQSFPSRLSSVAESMNPVLSLRPFEPEPEKDPRETEDLVIIIEPEVSTGPDPANGWPMTPIYAMSDPYLFEVLRQIKREPLPATEEAPSTTTAPDEVIDDAP